jgi:hypothetical protein
MAMIAATFGSIVGSAAAAGGSPLVSPSGAAKGTGPGQRAHSASPSGSSAGMLTRAAGRSEARLGRALGCHHHYVTLTQDGCNSSVDARSTAAGKDVPQRERCANPPVLTVGLW